MKDIIGDRMKGFYENRTKTFLPRKTNVLIRLDGKSFSKYTKGLQRPFDDKLISDMNETAKFLCENIQGAKYAFVQSDEISILITDYDRIETSAWFDNNVQKMASISASITTAKFNELRPNKLGFFDSRVFTIPDFEEVINYFIWRQKDCVRNSISTVAQNNFSNKELHKKTTNDMLVMLKDIDNDWNNYKDGEKRGRFIYKKQVMKPSVSAKNVIRNVWVVEPAQDFLLHKDKLRLK